MPYITNKFSVVSVAHFSYLTEEPVSKSDYLQVTVRSLLRDDISALEDLDLLPPDMKIDTLNQADAPADTDQDKAMTSMNNATTRTERSGTLGDLSWFEEDIRTCARKNPENTARNR